MKISTLIYSIKQGFKNIVRNKLFSLASIGTIATCIFIFGMFYAIVYNIQNMVKQAETSVCVTVFFNEGITQDEIDDIGDKIQARPEVSEIQFTSAEQAWEDYKEKYFSDNPDLADGFADDNPLADSASYDIYLNDVAEQDSLVEYLESMDGIRQVNKSEVLADSLTNFNRLVYYISAAIIIILIGVAIFLISNTITIGITVRKEEISIMKLIGSTDFFVKAPFIIEGLIIGLIGSLLPLLALYIVYERAIVYILTKFNVLANILTFLPTGVMFKSLVPVGLMLGIGIGLAGSFITIRKHINV